MAGLNECTNGCMSVVFRSCFSYQVAAGSTTSENIVVEVCRKSSDSSRSSFPSGASVVPAHVARRWSSRGLGGAQRRVGAEQVLEEVLVALAEEPSRLARHTARILGKFSGASGSSHANRRSLT